MTACGPERPFAATQRYFGVGCKPEVARLTLETSKMAQNGPAKHQQPFKNVRCSSVPYGCRTGPICGTRTGLAMP